MGSSFSAAVGKATAAIKTEVEEKDADGKPKKDDKGNTVKSTKLDINPSKDALLNKIKIIRRLQTYRSAEVRPELNKYTNADIPIDSTIAQAFAEGYYVDVVTNDPEKLINMVYKYVDNFLVLSSGFRYLLASGVYHSIMSTGDQPSIESYPIIYKDALWVLNVRIELFNTDMGDNNKIINNLLIYAWNLSMADVSKFKRPEKLIVYINSLSAFTPSTDSDDAENAERLKYKLDIENSILGLKNFKQ